MYSTKGQSVEEQLAIFKKSNLSFTTLSTEISSNGVQIILNLFLLNFIISFHSFFVKNVVLNLWTVLSKLF